MMKQLILFACALSEVQFTLGRQAWAAEGDAASQPWKNASLPFEQRATALVAQMTAEEKMSQLVALNSPAIPRLGIPPFCWWWEGLHGVMADGATVFPQAIGLGATWDTNLLFRVATAISDEGRAIYHSGVRKVSTGQPPSLTFFSPTINIIRDPRWGRTQECYSEDPFLMARLGVAFVRGIQGDDPRYLKFIATPKHYAVHSGPDDIRDRFNAVVNDHDLWDTYLPAFEASIKEGGAFAVIGHYSAVNGVPACMNQRLLTDILRTKWGFRGYAISDAGAMDTAVSALRYVPSRAESVSRALKAGLDLDLWGDSYRDELGGAIKSGLVTEKDVDQALLRLLEARLRLGQFDPPEQVPWTRLSTSIVNSPPHRALALEAARKSIVLLKNSGALLPLDRHRLKTVALIGPHATTTPRGIYSGTPGKPVSLLEGILRKLPSEVRLLHAEGCGLQTPLELVPASAFTMPEDRSGQPGLRAEYFANQDLEGAPVLVRTEPWPNAPERQASPAPGVPAEHFSARWTGRLTLPQTGRYYLRLTSDDGSRLFLDGRLVIDHWTPHAMVGRMVSLHLEAGRACNLVVEWFNAAGNSGLKLEWMTPVMNLPAMVQHAVEVARAADVVILALGIVAPDDVPNREAEVLESEGIDRPHIYLPSMQQRLLEAIGATGKPAVLVLYSGSPLAIPWAQEHVPAIVQAWYPGEEGGSAVADVLFGDFNPGGRLPVTFYASMSQLPPFEDYSMSNRTYRYFTGKPLYAFGHGLSYTTFKYSGLKLSASRVRAGEPLDLRATVENTGRRAGEEVVQVYLTDEEASAPVPIRKLVGFARVPLRPGEKRDLHFAVTPEKMAFIDDAGMRVLEPGRFRLTIGGNQGDARSRELGLAPPLATVFELTGKPLRSEP